MTSRTIKLVALAVFALVVGLCVHAWLVAQENQQRLQSTLTAQKKVIDDANSRQSARDAALNDTLAEIAKLKNTTQSSQQLVEQLQKYLALPQPILLVNRGPSSSASPGKRSSPVTTRSGLATGSAGTGSEKGNSQVGPGSQMPATIAELLIDQSRQQALSPIQVSSQRPSNSPPPRLRSNPPQPDQTLGSPTVEQSPLSTSAKTCSVSPDCAAEIPAADLKPLYNYVQDCRACDAELSVAKQNASGDAAKIAAVTRERDAAITASKGGSFLRRLRRDILWLSVGAAIGYASHR